MPMDRRGFMRKALMGAGGAMLAGSAARGVGQEAAEPDPFQLRPLGNTGIQVSLIGAGTGMRGWLRQSNQTRLGPDGFDALIRHGFDRGIRFFDCADLYGSHTHLARALAGIPREEYVVSTKIWVNPGGLQEWDRPGADVVVERFRRELNSDYVDIVLLHCMADPRWPDQQRRHLDLLAEAKAKGLIRAHGASVHSLPAMQAGLESPWVDSLNVRINAYGDNMDHPDPNVVVPVIRQLHDAGKGVVGMKLVGEGRYRNDPAKRDASIAYVLGLGCVDTMVVGFESPEEIDDFADRVAQALTAQPAVAPGG